jgi:Asp-tRNA(Asn)/Glu-tRNA(Gln) amidotransferase A subunit family amidase
MDFRRTTVAEIAEQVATRTLSAREVVQAALDRIDTYDDELGAFVAVDGDSALADAAAIDARIAGGEDVGALAGVPLAVKDLEDATGFVTSRGSAAYVGGPPAGSDSALVERLRAAGCVVVGKTNTPEFGWKADTVNDVSAPPATLGRWSDRPAARPGDRRRRSPPGWCPLRPGPTAVARSGSRRRPPG